MSDTSILVESNIVLPSTLARAGRSVLRVRTTAVIGSTIQSGVVTGKEVRGITFSIHTAGTSTTIATIQIDQARASLSDVPGMAQALISAMQDGLDQITGMEFAPEQAVQAGSLTADAALLREVADRIDEATETDD